MKDIFERAVEATGGRVPEEGMCVRACVRMFSAATTHPPPAAAPVRVPRTWDACVCVTVHARWPVAAAKGRESMPLA